MHNPRKQTAAAQRFAERRRREDEAPRLIREIPDLVALHLEIHERSMSTMQSKHIRRIVVANAPALFLVPCGDPHCSDGGHDITAMIMRGLRAREAVFGGDDECMGTLGTAQCTRVMHYEAFAEYRKP